MDTIVTRFPPSPTGYLHVGGARTALFNWLHSKNTGGKFVLRIEDTDTARSTQESTDAILTSLEWLGIDWDEGPYFQSERIEIHKEHIKKLIDSGDAYYCTCTPEEIDAMREKAKAEGKNPKYDGTCRDKNLPKTENAVVRFRTPQTGTTVLNDVIKKNIVFQNTEMDDFIVQRSDGTPMYNLAVVVDDITMGINTIIRGDDHVNNTPKQILLYKALKADLPEFGHVPMVLGKDKARLSKRHGAMSVEEYKKMGFLADAMINYLVRLGWSLGDQEFFTRDELIEKFTLKNIGKSAGVFDIDKLLALNADHIKQTDPGKLVSLLKPLLEERGVTPDSDEKLASVIITLQTRSKTLLEMADGALFYFKDEVEFDEKASKKFLKKALAEAFGMIVEGFSSMSDYTEKNMEDVFKAVMEKYSLGFGKLAQPVRVAVTGGTVSPGIFEMLLALGQEDTVKRMNKALDFMKNRED